MSEFSRQPSHESKPIKNWTSPENREAFEDHMRTSLGAYGYEFDSTEYSRLLAVDTIAEGVVKDMNKSWSSDKDHAEFKALYHANFDNPDGTFSSGVMVFGASSRENAERFQWEFVMKINETLEGVGANFRLDERH